MQEEMENDIHLPKAETTAERVHPWVAEGNQKVRAGVCFMDPCADWANYHACVQSAEDLGFDSLWVPDHPTIATDCWSMLSALAVTTRQIRLGSLVSCVYYRNPILLARQAADVDRFSQGRLVLGIGVGDLPFEFARLGLSFPKLRERREALETTLQAVRSAWQDLAPGPVQQPYIPFLIAGGGAQTLRQVARYADASNFGPHKDTGAVAQVEDAARKCQELDTWCAVSRRAPQSILRTHITLPLVLGTSPAMLAAKQAAIPLALRNRFASGTLALTPQEALAYYRKLIQAGLRYFILGLWPGDSETMHLFSQQVLPFLNE